MLSLLVFKVSMFTNIPGHPGVSSYLRFSKKPRTIYYGPYTFTAGCQANPLLSLVGVGAMGSIVQTQGQGQGNLVST